MPFDDEPPAEFGPMLAGDGFAARNVWRALGEIHSNQRRVWLRAFRVGLISGLAIGGVIGALIAGLCG